MRRSEQQKGAEPAVGRRVLEPDSHRLFGVPRSSVGFSWDFEVYRPSLGILSQREKAL